MDISPDDRFVIGIDFGTLSGRALVVRVSDGAELASAVTPYPHAVMDRTLTAADDQELPPDWALQDPDGYREVLRDAVPRAVRQSGIDPAQVIGVGTDFTASTVLPVLDDGTPVCEVDEFRTRPHAWVKLWKHHAAQGQADRINELAHRQGLPWIRRYGGLISSEWQFAKALQLLEEDPEVYGRTRHWVEAADWIIWQLTGTYTKNACTAGYKGILQDGEYPTREFLAELNPDFAGFVDDKLRHPISPLGSSAGQLSAQAAAWTGLPQGIAVAVGNVDAHVTVPAADASAPGKMVLIMGTSTCHVVNGSGLHEVPGMCGAVDGGITEGLWGYEAGQSGVGDIFAWFVDHAVPASYHEQAAARGLSVHELLTELCQDQAVGEHGLLALDWWSGNRSVLVDHELSGLLVGMTLTTRAEDIYRALLESTAFGTRTIIEAFTSSGVPIDELVVAGGLLKNAFLMQLYSDIAGLPLSTIISEQGPALGSAIHAAVAAGAYPDVTTAGHAMGGRQVAQYTPDAERKAAYDEVFAEYTALHDYFGRGGNEVMSRLKQRRRQAIPQRRGERAAATSSSAALGTDAPDPDATHSETPESAR